MNPLFSAMRRNKVGSIVIAVQMAITLAIMCNAIFIMEQRMEWSRRPTGVDEERLFAIDNQWVGLPEDLAARTRTDVEALRSVPGVENAFVTNSYPLTNSGMIDGASIRPEEDETTAYSSLYFVDEQAIATLGLKLIAGRNFNSSEVTERGLIDNFTPPVIIVSRAVATSLFPKGNGLGQSVYVAGSKNRTSTIIGIVDRLQMPFTGPGKLSHYVENSVLEPYRFTAQGSSYVVRTAPERLGSVMQAAQKKLLDVSRGRVLVKVRPLTEWRIEAYRDDRGLVTILGVVCAALIAVTAFGIVGLTSYWVSQRRRQIGVRRALGATRAAIVRYFQTENLVIAGMGIVAGATLAVALNLWMVSNFEMARLHFGYPVVGALITLLLGQCAVLWPALRAASIPPALATRSV